MITKDVSHFIKDVLRQLNMPDFIFYVYLWHRFKKWYKKNTHTIMI